MFPAHLFSCDHSKAVKIKSTGTGKKPINSPGMASSNMLDIGAMAMPAKVQLLIGKYMSMNVLWNKKIDGLQLIMVAMQQHFVACTLLNSKIQTWNL